MMPQIAEIREIDGELWVRVGVPGEFPSGISLWTPDEQKAHRKTALREAEEAVRQQTRVMDPYAVTADWDAGYETALETAAKAIGALAED